MTKIGGNCTATLETSKTSRSQALFLVAQEKKDYTVTSRLCRHATFSLSSLLFL